MVAKTVIAGIVALLAATGVATAQQNVVAVGRDHIWDNKSLVLQLGRQLRAETSRVGLSVYIDYSRLNASRPDVAYFSSDTSHVFRNTWVETQSRGVGLWLSASYTPIRWVVEPYLVAALGVRDTYGHVEIAPLDTVTFDGELWPSTSLYSDTESRFGPAANLGTGISTRVARLRIFGETRLGVGRNLNGFYLRRPLTLTVGVRF